MVKRDDGIPVRNSQEEYLYHMARAEYHINCALDQIDKPKGPKGSLTMKMLLGRARGIITGLYHQEVQNRRT